MGAKFLPLLGHPGVVRNVGCAMKRFLGLRKIVDLDKTYPETRPCVPVSRKFLRDLLEDRNRFVASAVVGQLQSGLHVGVGKILGDGGIVRRNIVGDGENGQIIFPLLFLQHSEHPKTDG